MSDGSDQRHGFAAQETIWLAAQKEAFQAAMNGAPLERSLGVIVDAVVKQADDGRRCAFYIADAACARLSHVVGMPHGYAEATEGLAISPESLACGLAIAQRAPVITPDVDQDARWAPWLWLTRAYGYRGCWSFPIETAAGQLVGSFTFYFSEPRDANPYDHELAAAMTQTAAIIISRHQENEERTRAEAALREINQRFRALVTAGTYSIYRMSADWRLMYQLDRETLGPTDRPIDDWADKYLLQEDRPEIFAAIERAIRTKSLFEFEHRVRRDDGSIGWILSRAVPLFEPDGTIREWFGVGSDVTERRAATEKLREREADLARVQRIGGVGGLNIDVAGGLRSWRSPEYLRLHGLPADVSEESHQDWRARVHPDDRESAEQALFAALDSDATIYDSEYRIVRPSDGAIRWIHARADIERGAAGEPLCLVGAHVDITDQKVAQQALRESEERLALAFRTLPVGVAILDTGGAIVMANEEMRRFLPSGAIPSRNSADASNWTGFAPDGSRVAANDFPAARALRGENVVPGIEMLFHPPDGRETWTQVLATPMHDRDGRISGAFAVVLDIDLLKRSETAMRESEERLLSAVDVGRLGLWDWNIATGHVHWSDEHYRMQGYAIGRLVPSYEAWLARLHPEDRDEIEAALIDARENRHEYACEYRTLLPDGRVRWLSARGRFFYDADGHPTRMVGAMIDTTEQRELRDRLQILVAELQHRVRNILTVVRSVFARTVETNGPIDEIADHFKGRLDSLARTQVIVTKSTTGQVDLENLIRDELLSVGASDGPNLTIEGPDVVLSSKEAETIGLAIHELTTNALKYGALKVPGASLTIRWETNVSDGSKPELNLTWTEQGVPAIPVQPARKGFGTELIEEALPYRLQAETRLEFRGGGVRCTMIVPLPTREDGARAVWR